MDGRLIPPAAGLAALYFILRRLARSRATRMKSPTIGFLDLSGGECRAQLEEDRTLLGPLFTSCRESPSAPPPCTVLFLYGRFGADGTLEGSGAGLRDLIRDSGALVAVVASENPEAHCLAAVRKKGPGRANLVLTLDRRGPLFPQFFFQLFSLMKQGIPMPKAWVRLAPQVPDGQGPPCPETFLVCEAGPLAFR